MSRQTGASLRSAPAFDGVGTTEVNKATRSAQARLILVGAHSSAPRNALPLGFNPVAILVARPAKLRECRREGRATTDTLSPQEATRPNFTTVHSTPRLPLITLSCGRSQRFALDRLATSELLDADWNSPGYRAYAISVDRHPKQPYVISM